MTDISLPRTAGRVGFAAGAAALLAFGLAAPAAADDATHQYRGNSEKSGVPVSMDGVSIGTNLFKLENRADDDSYLTAYCIDFDTSIRSGAWYKEDDWANYPGKGDFAEPKKVHWILQNGYNPDKGVDELRDLSDASSRLSDEQALAATQAAIWHFSNDVDLDKRNDPEIRAVYDYLISEAEELPQTEEPTSTLKITPEEASGNAGEVVGEFLVETNAADIEVDLNAPEGVELVDVESGEPVDTVNNGDAVGFSVPEDAEAGEASFSLETMATVQTGRLFRGTEEEPTQTLVTAEDGPVSVSADASASWGEVDEPEEPEEPEVPEEPEEPEQPEEPEESDEPEEGDEKPTPEDDDESLPVTGGALAGLIAAGVAALGAGGGALYMTRKRKASALDSDEG